MCKRKQLFMAITSLALSLALACPALAAENMDMKPMEISMDEKFESLVPDTDMAFSMPEMGGFSQNNDMQTSVKELMAAFSDNALSDNGMNFSEAFNEAAQDFQLNTNKAYDSVNAMADFGLVNLKFTDAAVKLDSFSAEHSSTINDSRTELSSFQETYGDIVGNVDMSAYHIPDGFDPFATAQSLGNTFQAAYGSNDKINSIASSINLTSIFDQASQPMNMPSLQSYENLQGLLSDISCSMKANSQSQYASDMAFVQGTSNVDALRSNLSSIISNTNALANSTGSAFTSNMNAFNNAPTGGSGSGGAPLAILAAVSGLALNTAKTKKEENDNNKNNGPGSTAGQASTQTAAKGATKPSPTMIQTKETAPETENGIPNATELTTGSWMPQWLVDFAVGNSLPQTQTNTLNQQTQGSGLGSIPGENAMGTGALAGGLGAIGSLFMLAF